MKIAKRVVELSNDDATKKEINRMKAAIKDRETKIERLLDNIEDGALAEHIEKRIKEREVEITDLKQKIAYQEKKLYTEEVVFVLKELQKGKIESKKVMKKFIDTIVYRIYIYDDEYRVLFYIGDEPNETDESRMQMVEQSLSVKANCVP